MHRLPFWGIFFREMRRYWKVPYQTLGTPLINALLYLFIFGLSLGRNIDLPGYASYLFFLIPGLVMMTAIKNAFDNASSSIVSSKYAGELIDLRTTPLTPIHIAWGYTLGGLSRGLIVAMITYITSALLVHFTQPMDLPMRHPWILIGFVLVNGCAFASMGLCVGMLSKNFDTLNAFSAFLLVPLIYLGGVFFSLDSLHPFWQKVSLFNPLLYMINGVRYGFLGRADVSVPLSALVSVASFVFFFSLALLILRRGRNYHW